MEQQCQPCPFFRNFVGIKLLGSYNRKKESKIAVAKDRERKEPQKIEQRKVWGPEWEPQVTQTALLARLIYIEQAQGVEKSQKEEPKLNGLFSCVFRVGPPSRLKDVFSPSCQKKKQSYNWAVTLIGCFKFLLQWDRTEEIKHSPNIFGVVSQI